MKYEYVLNKRESELLKEVIEKVMSKYSEIFEEYGQYYYILYLYNRLDDEIIKFRDKDILRGVLNALSSLIEYTDIIYIDNLIQIQNIISTLCINLYEML